MEQAHSTPWASLCEGANVRELRISNVERGGLLIDSIHPAKRSIGGFDFAVPIKLSSVTGVGSNRGCLRVGGL
jgi:hypothetical protein